MGLILVFVLKVVRRAYQHVDPTSVHELVASGVARALRQLDRYHLLGNFVRYVASRLPDALDFVQTAIATLGL